MPGSAGVVTFSENPALKQIGAKISRVGIRFYNVSEKDGDMIVGYSATFKVIGSLQATVSGDFDLKKLITSCSGLLCIAAKLLEGRNHAIDLEMKEIMGY